MTAHEKDVVSAFRAHLLKRLGNARYDVWFGGDSQIEFSDEGLRIIAPRSFAVDWLQTHFRRELDECAQAAAGREVKVELSAVAAAAAPPNSVAGETRGAKSNQSKEDEPLPLFAAATNASAFDGANAASKPESCPESHPRGSVAAPGRPRYATLAEYVVGPSNKVAWTAAQTAAEHPGGLTPVFLHGPTGVGKTHLLQGAFDALRLRRGVKAVIMTAERFTSEYVEAAQNGGLPSFRGKYRGINALVLDDVQFFCGKRRTCDEVLHTLETVHAVHGQIVLAADRPLAELRDLGEPLLARLQGGAQCELKPPDQSVRLGVAALAARRVQMALPPEVADLIAAEFTSHARELIGAVNRLKLLSLAERRPVDLDLAREAFRDCIRGGTRLVQLRDVEQAVCEVLGIDGKSIHGVSKSQAAARPRMLMMWLARKHTRLGLAEIGKHFGNRRHSTVVSAQKKVAQWLKQGEKLPLADRCAGVDEIIRQVEGKLRVG